MTTSPVTGDLDLDTGMMTTSRPLDLDAGTMTTGDFDFDAGMTITGTLDLDATTTGAFDLDACTVGPTVLATTPVVTVSASAATPAPINLFLMVLCLLVGCCGPRCLPCPYTGCVSSPVPASPPLGPRRVPGRRRAPRAAQRAGGPERQRPQRAASLTRCCDHRADLVVPRLL